MKDEDLCHDDKQIFQLRVVYTIFMFLWTYIAFSLGLFSKVCNWVEWLILLLPIFIFSIGFFSVPDISHQVEGFMFRANLLTLGLLVALPLLNWMNERYQGDKLLFMKLISIAIIFSMLTLIDVWVPHRFLPIIKHIRSALQTISITLLIYVLFRFYIEESSASFHEKSTKVE